MSKILCAILILFTVAQTLGQGIRDTLEVSKKFKTILIFRENVAESIIGNDFGFVVDLPKTNGSRYNGRILKLYYDELGKETINHTNQTVITESGNVYDFILKLTDTPQQLTWHIKPSMANANIVGNSIIPQARNTAIAQGPKENRKVNSVISSGGGKRNHDLKKIPLDSTFVLATDNLYNSNPMEYYRLRCYYMQFDKAKISRYFSRVDNLFLWLKGVYYNKDELYIQFKIENKEGLGMDVNFFKYSLATTYKGSSSNQKLEIKPIFLYKQPKMVEGKSENHFVVVFKKFALDEKTELMVEMDEESGNRNLSLGIEHHIINNPIHF